MADHSMEQKFIKMNYRAAIVFTCAFLLIITFFSAGGWASARDSVANIRWLKRIAPNGIDQQFLFPLGICGDEQALSKEGEQNAPQPASPYLAGLAALRIGDLLNAEQLLQRAMDEGISPNSSPYALGVVYYMEGKEAISLWQNNDVYKLLKTGRICDLADEKEDAEKYYHLVLENIEIINNFQRENISRQLVDFFSNTQDDESFTLSLQYYLSNADSNSLEYYWTLGNAWNNQNQPERAMEYYQNVIKLTPNDFYAWYVPGRMFLKLGDNENAQLYFSQAILQDIQEQQIYIDLGDTYRNQEKYEEAAKWYSKLLIVNPNSSNAMTRLAEVYIALQRYDEASELISHAIMIDKNNSYTRSLGAEVAKHMEDWELARQFTLEAIIINPDNINLYYRLNKICEELNDIACQIEAYNNILLLHPNDIDAKVKIEKLKSKLP